MKYIKYNIKKGTIDCITQCPYGLDRMVGSLGCEACKYHYMKFAQSREVVCSYEDSNKKG